MSGLHFFGFVFWRVCFLFFFKFERWGHCAGAETIRTVLSQLEQNKFGPRSLRVWNPSSKTGLWRDGQQDRHRYKRILINGWRHAKLPTSAGSWYASLRDKFFTGGEPDFSEIIKPTEEFCIAAYTDKIPTKNKPNSSVYFKPQTFRQRPTFLTVYILVKFIRNQSIN